MTARRLPSGRALLTLLAIALPAAAAGCGGKTATIGPAHVVRVSADATGALSFHPTHATTAAGEVELLMSNPSPIGHGIAIDGGGVSSIGAVVSRGSTSTVTAKLKPGNYTFYCPVPGHRQAGMHGTLTVR